MRRFAFQLALALGCTVRELLDRIDAAELTEWVAYFRLEPQGPYYDDVRAGLICSTLANCHRSANASPFRPQDFMPFRPEAKFAAEEQDTKAAVAAITRLLGGQVG